MTTVAVAPFFNLSAEPSVDGRRFAMAYYAELQKTANYQVVPVGVVEAAIRENDLDLNSPADALKLAELLDVDAVVVGAVTDYNPYYPPQLGVHVQWYSPREWIFYPGVTGETCDDPAFTEAASQRGKLAEKKPVVRGQSDDDAGTGRSTPFPGASYNPSPIRLAQSRGKGGDSNNPNNPPAPSVWPPPAEGADALRHRHSAKSSQVFCPVVELPQGDFPQPVMTYTRFFDGADPVLISTLKAYYVYRDDMRSGGWEAYLHRSDDFIRFTSHLMVVEMLSLHGGELVTDSVFRFRKWR